MYKKLCNTRVIGKSIFFYIVNMSWYIARERNQWTDIVWDWPSWLAAELKEILVKQCTRKPIYTCTFDLPIIMYVGCTLWAVNIHIFNSLSYHCSLKCHKSMAITHDEMHMTVRLWKSYCIIWTGHFNPVSTSREWCVVVINSCHIITLQLWIWQLWQLNLFLSACSLNMHDSVTDKITRFQGDNCFEHLETQLNTNLKPESEI